MLRILGEKAHNLSYSRNNIILIKTQEKLKMRRKKEGQWCLHKIFYDFADQLPKCCRDGNYIKGLKHGKWINHYLSIFLLAP